MARQEFELQACEGVMAVDVIVADALDGVIDGHQHVLHVYGACLQHLQQAEYSA